MKKKQFLKYPEFPGGKVSLRKYISDNQVYPEEARWNKVEGSVYLSADVNDDGQVTNIRVDKGIGYGCDEEAVRLLQGMHFGSVSNRGFRMKTRKKFRIPFKPEKEITSMEINYSMKKKDSRTDQKSSTISMNQPYSYTIKWTDPQLSTGNTDTPDK